MCGAGAKITFVDFDTTGVAWLGAVSGGASLPAGARGIVPASICRKVFETFLNGGIDEVRAGTTDEGLPDPGTARDITYLTREEFKRSVGDEQYKLETQWA